MPPDNQDDAVRMIISHTHNFILMMGWKTASSTCRRSLERYDESNYQQFFAFNPILNRVVHQHITLAEFNALPEARRDYKIGAFVRNPYDRAYSAFIQIQRDFESHPRFHFQEAWVGDLVRTQISENMRRVVLAAFDFNKWLQLLPDYEVFDVGRNASMVLHPAHYWTHIGGRQLAEFVGKVESFQSDFQRFCAFAGIDPPEIINANVSEQMEALEASSSKYAGRMSRRSLDRVNDLFQEDFRLFDYERL